MEHVAGYTISNDVSTRDLLFRPGFPMTDFLHVQVRPVVLPDRPIHRPARVRRRLPRAAASRCSVNGEAMQDELVEDIIYGVEELVAYASTITELRPGDLLLTGSPAGNAGHHGNRWLRPGDVMEGRSPASAGSATPAWQIPAADQLAARILPVERPRGATAGNPSAVAMRSSAN